MDSAPRIADLPDAVGDTVTLEAWLTGLRSSGKIAFLQLRDGSGFVQAVLPKGAVDEATFDAARRLEQESALRVTGEVREDARAPSGVELSVTGLETVSCGGDYPISPKEHGVDFLFERRHLHLRHRRPWATLRVRDTVERSIHDFLAERGFLRFDAPLFMPTAVEGTTNLFEIDLFGEQSAYLSQSGQLYAEAGALAFGSVYTFGPTFRAEKSKTRRHLLEFWMVEPEVAWLDHEGNMRLQEELVAYLAGRVVAERGRELELLERDPTPLERTAEGGFPRLRYDEALAKLAEAGEELAWGDDFGAPHETILGDLFDRPVFIEAWPAHTKAFYMEPFEDDPRYSKCADLIAPEGYGEIIGGSQRIHDLSLLEKRIDEHGLPRDAFAWYVDLRRHGSVPHSGFGMGIERLLAWFTGAQHLREVVPFPRMLTRMYP
jgi:asparaginyl-tRNA synthetase